MTSSSSGRRHVKASPAIGKRKRLSTSHTNPQHTRTTTHHTSTTLSHHASSPQPAGGGRGGRRPSIASHRGISIGGDRLGRAPRVQPTARLHLASSHVCAQLPAQHTYTPTHTPLGHCTRRRPLGARQTHHRAQQAPSHPPDHAILPASPPFRYRLPFTQQKGRHGAGEWAHAIILSQRFAQHANPSRAELTINNSS